jgi:hypothetical protein
MVAPTSDAVEASSEDPATSPDGTTTQTNKRKRQQRRAKIVKASGVAIQKFKVSSRVPNKHGDDNTPNPFFTDRLQTIWESYETIFFDRPASPPLSLLFNPASPPLDTTEPVSSVSQALTCSVDSQCLTLEQTLSMLQQTTKRFAEIVADNQRTNQRTLHMLMTLFQHNLQPPPSVGTHHHPDPPDQQKVISPPEQYALQETHPAPPQVSQSESSSLNIPSTAPDSHSKSSSNQQRCFTNTDLYSEIQLVVSEYPEFRLGSTPSSRPRLRHLHPL